jgi:streptogrisin C
MKPLKCGGACIVVVVLFATALAASAHATTQSSTGSAVPIIVAPPSLDPFTSAEVAAVAQTGVPLPQAREAIAVQSAVERTDLIDKLDAALGEAFGGVWYDRAAAQLNVGVTSPDAARIAEAVAVRAGLGLQVTEIPVRSSEAELTAVQAEFDDRLAGLFGRAEVATRASVDDNSVQIELGSKVSADERAALEGEASQAPVEVVVSVASGPKLQLAYQAQCRKFEASKAFCDPTIVGGTSLEDSGAKKEPQCTVGPAVAQPKGSTELYVLTAGHCVKAVGESFFSLNKEGKETKEIGKATAILTAAAGEADVAAIKIEGKFWKKEGEVPVVPKIAQWSKAGETEPFRVKEEEIPAKGGATCISGQTSGFHCGVIKETKVTIEGLKELVEVEKIETLGGDSGSPWFSEKEKKVQGTHVGEIIKTKVPVFQALQWSFKKFKEVSGLELELLTEKNEKRM